MNVAVSWSGGNVLVTDVVNRRIVVIGFDHAAQETCEVK
jgi:hypothetical protein